MSQLFVKETARKYRPATEAETLQHAHSILAGKLVGTQIFDSPQKVKDFLCITMGALEHEVFSVVLLDAQHRVLEYVELFRGTLTQTSVYPREVVKLALLKNAAALILAHNHPSGVPEPSRADEYLTSSLKNALALVDVRVLDHIVVGRQSTTSFAERGLL